MTITPEEIARLRELEENASPGPWGVDATPRNSVLGEINWINAGGFRIACMQPPSESAPLPVTAANAAFIAAARNILPRLLEAYETEKAAREQERNRFVSGASAERYWEARWRDEKARADRLAKALRDLINMYDGNYRSPTLLDQARDLLAEEPKT